MVYRPQKNNSQKTKDVRLNVILTVFLFLALLVSMKLFKIQIIDHDFFTQLARGQHDTLTELEPVRGEIFVNDQSALYPIAANRKLSLLFVVPKEIEEHEKTIEILSQELGFADQDDETQLREREKLSSKVNKSGDPYEPVKGELSDDFVAKIKQHNLKGVYFSEEYDRFYPDSQFYASLTGFLGYQGNLRVGQYGIEGNFNSTLSGQFGELAAEKDVSGRFIAVGDQDFKPPVDGSNIILTIDRAVQVKTCEYLAEAVDKYPAESGVAIVMDPYTGEIKALCNYPAFDANNYSQVEDARLFSNKAISDAWEPGSIFKVITMAAGLDSGAVEADTTFVDEGSVKIGKYTIRNAENKVYGESNMTSVLENSINTGVVYISDKTGLSTFKEYIRRFGFGTPTGVKLPHENAGNLSSLDKDGDIYLATASFGQGITATPIQMITAFAAIGNGGTLIKPYLIKKIEHPDGSLEIFETEKIRQVISNKTATILKAMLVSVVKNGHAKNAEVEGYYVAGKTGTAQVASQSKAGYSSETIHSFVGFTPVDHPRFVVLTRLDKPKVDAYAVSTAAPLFAKITKFLVQYYQVPPDY